MASNGFRREEDAERPSLKERLSSTIGSYMNRTIGSGGKVSWGLLLFIAVGIYALYILAKNILYFFG